MIEPPRRARSQAGWIAGAVAFAILAYITLNTLWTTPAGSRGVPDGEPLPPFAVPLALSPLDGDANVATRADEGAAGRRPACSVRGPDVLNSCALVERGPLVLTFLTTHSRRCEQQVDVVERVRARHPRVQFAAVAIRGDRDALRRLVRARRWREPVGWDRDGAVANEYAVAICPVITFARRGGRAVHTLLGAADTAAVERWVARIE